MGINPYTKRTDYPSRCKWYKAEYVEHGKLVDNAECEGVFYCKDAVDYQEIFDNSFGVAGQIIKTVTIETPDNIPDIHINDYVFYDGELWRVNSIPSKDDLSKSKFYRSRPQVITRLELRC